MLPSSRETLLTADASNQPNKGSAERQERIRKRHGGKGRRKQSGDFFEEINHIRYRPTPSASAGLPILEILAIPYQSHRRESGPNLGGRDWYNSFPTKKTWTSWQTNKSLNYMALWDGISGIVLHWQWNMISVCLPRLGRHSVRVRL